MIRPDCFAFSERDCKILTKMMCKDKECKFYKTMKQYSDSMMKAERSHVRN